MDRTFRSEAPGFGSVDIFKSLKGYTHQFKFTFIQMRGFKKKKQKLSSADPGGGPASAPCVAGNTGVDLTHRVHQTPAAGVSYLGDLHRQEMSSPNYPSRLQASVAETHQAASEASLHPGLYSFQNQDRRVASLSSSDYSHSVPPGYDQLVDISLQLSNLSTQSLNIVFRGENLDLTDATPALNSGSKVPRHPGIGQLESDSGQSKMSTNGLVTNVWHSGPSNHPSVSPGHKPHQGTQARKCDVGVKTQNLQKRLDWKLSLFGSPEDGSHTNGDGTRGVLPGYEPPLFPSQPHHGPGQSSKHEDFPFAQIKFATLQSEMDPLRPVSPQQGSPARSQSEDNLERSGSTEQRNADAISSKVHTVRVKPPSRFFSANPLRQKPSVRPLKSGPRVPSSQEHRADQGPSSTHLSPNQQTPPPKTGHSPTNHRVAGTGQGGSLGSAFALINSVQAAGKIGTASFKSQRHNSC